MIIASVLLLFTLLPALTESRRFRYSKVVPGRFDRDSDALRINFLSGLGGRASDKLFRFVPVQEIRSSQKKKVKFCSRRYLHSVHLTGTLIAHTLRSSRNWDFSTET
jgi:hypothetical protein